MDDLKCGTRNKRGDWSPSAQLEIAPFWAWPPHLGKVLAWIPGYLWPWNAFYMATALAYWRFVVPDIETMKTMSWSWALWLYAVNGAAIFILYGFVELFYYAKRKQGSRFKFNAKFPADHPSDVFWFKNQNIDNFLRSFLISIPLWTVVEVLMLWAFTNGFAPWLRWSDHPWYLAALVLVAPAIHEERWLAKFGQVDKWSFCLRAAKVPHVRSDNGETRTPDPQSGLQGEGGIGRHQG